jgi:hypothetical protein
MLEKFQEEPLKFQQDVEQRFELYGISNAGKLARTFVTSKRIRDKIDV